MSVVATVNGTVIIYLFYLRDQNNVRKMHYNIKFKKMLVYGYSAIVLIIMKPVKLVFPLTIIVTSRYGHLLETLFYFYLDLFNFNGLPMQ